MEDEGISSGLGSLALYQLGHLDGEVQRRHDDAVSAFSARLRGYVPVNVDAVLADNQALRQNGDALWRENQALRQHGNALWRENQDLRQHDDALWHENQQLRQQVKELQHELRCQYNDKREWMVLSKAFMDAYHALLAQKAVPEDDIPW